MTREFFGKVLACGIVKTRKHVYSCICGNGLRKIVRDDGMICAVYVA